MLQIVDPKVHAKILAWTTIIRILGTRSAFTWRPPVSQLLERFQISPEVWRSREISRADFRVAGSHFHLETIAKLLILLGRNSALFSKCALESLNNQTDFDSAILRFAQARHWCRNPRSCEGLRLFIWKPGIWKKGRFVAD